ncbi:MULTISPECIES: hypothetical protein [Pantoea]|nr:MULTISPECIES: hypothetical protein [Pantoea]
MSHLANWATNWQKDPRFSKNYTERLIEKACAIDSQLMMLIAAVRSR